MLKRAAKKYSKGSPKGNKKRKLSEADTKLDRKRPAEKQQKKEPKKKVLRDVKAAELEWKPIDVSAHLDDFEGFYELEELEGVDVEVDNGIVKFKKIVDEEPEPEEETGAEADASSAGVEAEPVHQVEKKTKVKAKQKKETAKKNAKAPKESTADAELSNAFELLNEDVDTSNLEWGATGSHLSIPLLKALSKQNFTTPTEIQRLAIPAIMEGRDVVGKAATGSGKTLAYGIPIIEKHIAALKKNKDKSWPTGLVLAPTRELSHQISEHLERLWKFCAFEQDQEKYGPGVISITGGLSVQKQKRLLQQRPALVVATPGRLLDILEEGKQEIQDMIGKAEVMVLDEADRLIKEGHFKELDKILDLIGRGRRTGRQTLVISATFEMDLMNKLAAKRKLNYPSKSQEILSILDRKLEFKDRKFRSKKNAAKKDNTDTETNGPLFLDANPAEAVASKIVESIMECGAMEKDLYLYYFLVAHPGRTIVFVNSIESVKRISPMLKELGLTAFGLHSDMIQKQRLRSLEQFKANDQGILISTDVAARGLDIPLVQHVIHYHLPRTADMYVHRSGRTARAGNEGVSLVICSPEEASGPLVKLKSVLYKKMGTTPKAMKTFEVDYQILKRLKPRVALAKEIADSSQEITRRGKSNAWLQKAAEDLGVDLSDDEDGNGSDSDDNSKDPALSKKAKAAQIKELRHELQQELAKPVGYGGKYITRGTVNMAQVMSSANAHSSFLGKTKTSALQALK